MNRRSYNSMLKPSVRTYPDRDSILYRGLQAWYTFEPPHNNYLDDYSGKLRFKPEFAPGANSPTWSRGHPLLGGHGVTFDRTASQYVQMTPLNTGDTFMDFGLRPFTIATWLVPLVSAVGGILTKDNFAGSGNGIYFYLNDPGGGYRFLYWNGSVEVAASEIPVVLNKLYHVVIIRRGTGTGEVELWNNGRLLNTTTEARDLNNANRTCYMGVFNDNSYTSMTMCDLRIWHRALPRGAVQKMYSQPTRWNLAYNSRPGPFGVTPPAPAGDGGFKSYYNRGTVFVGGGIY
jgi:hypothetical protein